MDTPSFAEATAAARRIQADPGKYAPESQKLAGFVLAGDTERPETLGFMCPVCFHGAAGPFSCGGPHPRPKRKRLYYDFVDAVPVARAALAEGGV